MQCKAKSKQSGERCKKDAMLGKEVCHIHGGKSLVGAANPNFRNGKYTKYLPARMLDRYNQSLKDPKALAQRHEIAIVESRIEDLMRRTDNGESSAFINELRALVRTYENGTGIGNEHEAKLVLKEIFSRIKSVHADYRAWDDVNRWITTHDKLIASERKRQIESKQTVTIDEMMTLVAALSDVMKRHITDMKVLSAVTNDIGRLINTGSERDSKELSVN